MIENEIAEATTDYAKFLDKNLRTSVKLVEGGFNITLYVGKKEISTTLVSSS